MALNYVFGMQPGESQIANAASQLNANNQRDIDRQISLNQAAVSRQQQAEQFDRQMKQQRTFGAINAGLGIAQTVMGIPNFVGAVKDMFGPTARQQQAGQFAEDMALKRAHLGIQAASAGTDAAVKLANAESLKIDREAKLERAQSIYGTNMMLDDVPRQHQEYLIDLASKGDPIARTQAMNMGLMVHTDYQKSQIASLQRERQQIANNPEYDEFERAYAFSQIDGQLQLLQNSPVVNRNRQLSGQERANAAFQTVNITQPDGTVYSQPVQVNSRGNFEPVDTPATIRDKKAAEELGKMDAVLQFKNQNPNNELIDSIVGLNTGSGSGSGSGSRSRGGGVGNGLTNDGFDPANVDFDSRLKMIESIRDSKLKAAEANLKENETLDPASIVVTPDDVNAYLNAMSAFESRSAQIKTQRMSAIGKSLIPTQPSMQGQPINPQVSAPTMVTQQMPGDGPVGSQAPFPNNAAMSAPQAVNPPMANIPSDRPQIVKLATRQKITIPPVDTETTKSYLTATQNIPRIPGTEIVPLESDGKNLAAAMGLEKLYMIRDSRSELPWIPSIPKVLAKFTEVAPPNAQFYDYKGIKRTITKPAQIPK